MKSRMESARARPDGPLVRLAQSIVMDIYMVVVFFWWGGSKVVESEAGVAYLRIR